MQRDTGTSTTLAASTTHWRDERRLERPRLVEAWLSGKQHLLEVLDDPQLRRQEEPRVQGRQAAAQEEAHN